MAIDALVMAPVMLTPPSPPPAPEGIGKAQHHEAAPLRFSEPMPLLPQLHRPEQRFHVDGTVSSEGLSLPSEPAGCAMDSCKDDRQWPVADWGPWLRRSARPFRFHDQLP